MKSKAINNLISYLNSKFDPEKIQEIDYWEADNCAIGFTNQEKDKIIYISSFQKKLNQFYVEVEYKNDSQENKIFDNLTDQEVEKLSISLFMKNSS